MDYSKSLLVWIVNLLNFLIDSMASQNLEDWEFFLAHLLDDPNSHNLLNHQHLDGVLEMKRRILSVVANHVQS